MCLTVNYMHGLKKSLKPGKNSYIPFALLKNIIAELSTIALMRGSVWFCEYRNSVLVIKPFIYFISSTINNDDFMKNINICIIYMLKFTPLVQRS